jgi:hypothetical protein
MDVARNTEREVGRKKIRDALMPTVVLVLCFVLSGAVGCWTAAASDDSAANSLSAYLQAYLAIFAQDASAAPSIWAVLWELCRWPVLVLALGSTALGAVGIPAVFFARGFLLAYSIAAFVRVFGNQGLLGALAIFGVTTLVGVPVLFAVGSVSFPVALRQALSAAEEHRIGVSLRDQIIKLVPCTGLMALAVVLQWALVPQLVNFISTLLTTS